MTFRRPSFLLSAASAVSGMLAIAASAISGASRAAAPTAEPTCASRPRVKKPYVAIPKSYIRGTQFGQRQVVTNQMRCDARNYPAGKIYSDLDERQVFAAIDKRERKWAKAAKDAEAQRRGMAYSAQRIRTCARLLAQGYSL